MRQTNPSLSYIKDIDGLRALAVILVIVGHWWENSYSTFLGFAGVTLFFVISGFLITFILMQYKENVAEGKSIAWYFKTFYARRTLRIFPIYYLYLFFLWSLGFGFVREGLDWFFMYAGNHFIYNVGYYPVLKSHLWSLAVEEQFYLLWPLVILLTPKRHFVPLFVGFIFLALGFKLYFFCYPSESIKPAFAYMLTPSCFDAFAIGALLALNQMRNYITSKAILVLAGLSLLALLGIYSFYPAYAMLCERLFFSVFSAGLIVLAIHGFKGAVKLVLSNTFMIQIGKLSYGLYLYHLIVPYLLFRFLEFVRVQGKDASFLETAVGEKSFYLIVTIVLVFVSWHFVEKPINGLKKYFR